MNIIFDYSSKHILFITILFVILSYVILLPISSYKLYLSIYRVMLGLYNDIYNLHVAYQLFYSY